MNSFTVINWVKYNKIIGGIYNYIGSIFLSLLKLFLHTDENLIIFTSYGGRKYDDSPKAIYEAMLDDPRFNSYQIVWAFMRPEMHKLPRGRKIKINTLLYFMTLLRARVWVTNSSMTRGLNFTGIKTFEMNTWHGSAIKRMGSDIKDGNNSFRLKGEKRNPGVMLAQSQYDVDVFSRAFHRPVSDFRIIGLPRNDVLAHVSEDMQKQAKEKLGISMNKKVILYAPTFREYEKDRGYNCVMAPPIDLKRWKKKLGQDYVLLLRPHYEVTRVMTIEENEFVKNVSNYPNLNELMIASDMLISDYSSIFFDYAIQGKPMLCYTYDYERYDRERGMYFDIRKELQSDIENEDVLLEEIISSNVSERDDISRKFRDKYIEKCGNATQLSLDIIHEALS